RYSGQEDVSIGSPIANRNRAEIEKLIGFFVNMLVLRTDLGGEPSFSEVLRRVKQTALEAYVHQDFPFEKLVEEVSPERTLSHNPLVQVSFSCQTWERKGPGSGAAQERGVEFEVRSTKFDIEWDLMVERGELIGNVVYSRELFEEETIRRMV